MSATITAPSPSPQSSPSEHAGTGTPVEATKSADPRFVHVALAALLGLTGVLYLWGLSDSGYGNDFYAAAVQAGTHSWKAFFFGSFDAQSFITVDKPPA